MSSVPLIQVRSVLIPLVNNLLLLPNVVVAEVINYTKPIIRPNVPEWLLGDIAWRGTSVPLVSIEGMLGHAVVEPVYRGRTIVMNTINGQTSLPHIGVVAQSIPSLVQVTSETIDVSDSPVTQNGLVKQSVEVNDEQAFIPDLDELERLVLEYLEVD